MNSRAASPKPSSGTDQDDQCRPAGALPGWASRSIDPGAGLVELARLGSAMPGSRRAVHLRQDIDDSPGLSDPAIDEPANEDLVVRDGFAGWRDAQVLTPVGPGNRVPADDLRWLPGTRQDSARPGRRAPPFAGGAAGRRRIRLISCADGWAPG